jgi:hypothetical protein
VPKKQGEKPTMLPEVHILLIAPKGKHEFSSIAHEIVPKDEKWQKNGRTCILYFFPQAAKKKKSACFFLPDLRSFSLLGGKIVGKPGTRGKINDRKI